MDRSAHTFTLDNEGGTEDAIRERPLTSSLRTWADLAAGRLSFAEYFERLANLDDLTCLSIDTTGACDLTCKGMCYYHPSIRITDREVPLDSLTRAIEDAWKMLRMRTLVVAGKEPFLNPRRLFELLEFSGRLPGRDFATAVVTNGRHIERHWDRLARTAEQGWLDSLDISIDSGFPEQHDAIRGVAGTYALAVSALRRVILELPMVRLSVGSVLRTDNPAGILELIRSQSHLVRRFWVFPVQPPPFSAMAPLTPGFVVSFLRDLANLLSGELRDAELVVSVPIQGLYLAEVADAGLIHRNALREDGLGSCVSSLSVGKSLLNLQCCVLPEHAIKLARITYTGDYLAQSHFLQTPDPGKMAVGNVDREPIRELYRRSKLPGSIFHQLVLARQSHDCIRQSCWQTCFGGWSVAEQSLLDGTTLDRRSRLCRKGQSDLVSIAGVTIS
jgi:MoaA/NifB/PqqE/SkfB family radical SAM enzyme